MKLKINTLLLFGLLLLTSCGGDNGEKKLLEQLSSSYEYDEKVVELEGYMGMPVLLVAGDSISIGLHSAPLKQSNDLKIANLRIKFSKEPNSYFVPISKHQAKFMHGQVDIYDSEGERNPLVSKVKIKGKVVYLQKNWQKILDRDIDNDSSLTDKQKESLKETQKKARTDAEKRKTDTGDANNYRYRIAVNTITALDKK